MQISHRRINAIYYELKRLPIDDFTNSGSVLLRVFLELSLDEFIDSKQINLPKNKFLFNKIICVAEYLENNGVMTEKELKPAKDAANKPHGLFSTNTLNAYVHNSLTQPKPTELKLTWDEMELFVKKLWE